MPDQVGPEIKNPLRVCQEGTDRMWDLATHLLDIYKIEAGMVKIDKVVCDLVGLVERQIRELEGIIAKRGIRLNREIFGKDLSVFVSEDKINLVLKNLALVVMCF